MSRPVLRFWLRGPICAAVVLLTLMLADVASAGTISPSEYSATAGQSETLSVSVSVSEDGYRLVGLLKQPTPLSYSAGCYNDAGSSANPNPPADYSTFACNHYCNFPEAGPQCDPLPYPATVALRLGDGDDNGYLGYGGFRPDNLPVICPGGTCPLDLRIDGEDGNDSLSMAYGDVRLNSLVLVGGNGNDQIFLLAPGLSGIPATGMTVDAGPGNDRINGQSGTGSDTIQCGPGFDEVLGVGPEDIIWPDCESVNGTTFAQPGAPLAAPEACWTKEFGSVTYPAPGVLGNDHDPTGSTLTAKVVKTNFAGADHPYKLEPDGTLTFEANATPKHKPFIATITYQAVNSAGQASRQTTVQIYIQPMQPKGIESCASWEGDADFQSGAKKPPKGFSWEMAERYNGADHNGDGYADYFSGTHKSTFAPGKRGGASQIAPSVWQVNFDATGCKKGTMGLHWVVDGDSVAAGEGCSTTVYFSSSKSPNHTMVLSSGKKVIATHTVRLKDWLIVSIGDSYASGEGAPDSPKHDGHASKWEDKQCHRSSKAGSALAAAKIENADPHSSVTFIHLACSGATVLHGLLGSYNGAPPDDDSADPEPPQVTALANLLDGRKPDVILLSIGGNDIGFSEIIKGCIKSKDCPDGDPGKQFRSKIKILPGRYDQVAASLQFSYPGAPVLITQYPDSTRGPKGQICGSDGSDEIFSDSPLVGKFSLYKLTTDEAEWASKTVAHQLNGEVASAAARAGWRVVGSHLGPWLKHGYCASDRWINTYDDARDEQEGVPGGGWEKILPDPSPGTFHPNVKGQHAYEKAILDALQAVGISG